MTFGGAVSLTSLDVTGVTYIDGGSVTTTGFQTYNSNVWLGAGTVMEGTNITFGPRARPGRRRARPLPSAPSAG